MHTVGPSECSSKVEKGDESGKKRDKRSASVVDAIGMELGEWCLSEE
jgi:hypothetical protein